MANPTTNLRVRISADLADIKQGLGLLRGELAKVKQEAARATPDTSKWVTGIGNVRSALGNLAGAYIGLRGITVGIQALFAAVDRADRIGELAVQSGLSTEALSRLAYAAKFSGVDIESLNGGIVKFSRTLASNAGMVQKLGIEVFEAGTKNFRPTEAILLDLADVFASLPEGPERAALAIRLFGRSGAELIPLLVEGKAKIMEYGDQAKATGNELSTSASEGASKFNDNLDRLKGTLTGLANETVKNVIPAISNYTGAAAASAQGSGHAAEGGRILANAMKGVAVAAIIVKNIVEGATNVIAFLGETAFRVSGIVGRTLSKTLGALADSYKGLLSGENPFTVLNAFRDSLKGVGAGVQAELGRVRAGFGSMKDGLTDANAGISDAFRLFDKVAEDAAKSTTKVGDAASDVKPASEAALAALRKLLGGDGEGGGSSGSKAEDKLKRLRDAAERLRKESEASAEKIRQELMARDERIDSGLQDARIAELNALGQTAEANFLQIDDKWAKLLADLKAAANQGGIDLVNRVINLEKFDARLQELKSRSSAITSELGATEASLSAQVTAGLLGSLEGERQLRAARAEALAQLRELREAAIAALMPMNPASPEAAGARTYLQGLNTDIANIIASQNKWKQDVEDAGQSSLMTFFNDLKTGAMSASDAVRALAANFADSLFQMAAAAVSKKIVGAISGLFNKGGGEQGADVAAGAAKLTGAATATALAGGAILFGSTSLSNAARQLQAAATTLILANSLGSFGAAHGGGVAGRFTMMRHNISPLVFGAAPRYHRGGIAGLRPGEVPAILEEGERIRTVEQERALQARLGGGKTGMVTTPIVAIGEEAIANALASAAGERIVITHVRANWAGLSRGDSGG